MAYTRISPEVVLIALGDPLVDARLPHRLDSVLDAELIAPRLCLSPAYPTIYVSHLAITHEPRLIKTDIRACTAVLSYTHVRCISECDIARNFTPV